jgi:ABC-type multidrug transport system ATPase subunit
VDTENLFAVAKLRQRGVSVVYISHFLEECQRVCDRYTVLRDGESVGAGAMAGVELSEIIRLMVGREVKDIYPRLPHALGRARSAGISRTQLQAFFTQALCSPVLTAHPTEIRRKSSIDREMEIARLLDERDRIGSGGTGGQPPGSAARRAHPACPVGGSWWRHAPLLSSLANGWDC